MRLKLKVKPTTSFDDCAYGYAVRSVLPAVTDWARLAWIPSRGRVLPWEKGENNQIRIAVIVCWGLIDMTWTRRIDNVSIGARSRTLQQPARRVASPPQNVRVDAARRWPTKAGKGGKTRWNQRCAPHTRPTFVGACRYKGRLTARVRGSLLIFFLPAD